MTSHRDAPSIAKDPVADNTDVYAFVSPDKPDTVTIIANYIPFEEPAGGPNFHQFGDDVLYEIKIDNNGDAVEDITYQFAFKTTVTNPGTFLYNTGPIKSLDDRNWNIRQVYSVTRVTATRRLRKIVLGGGFVPPVRIGPRSTPDYKALADAAIMTLSDGSKVFAGQRGEGFWVDLGSIFDLGTLRPFQNLHLISTPSAAGVNALKGFNVHSIALQVPKRLLTRGGIDPKDRMDPKSVLGIWATACRQRVKVLSTREEPESQFGPFTQVSRLGNCLVNETLIPLEKKDAYLQSNPDEDEQFLPYIADPQLQNLLPILYPGVFPNLKALLDRPVSQRPRNDLVAIILTGIPEGLIPNFQNYTGPILADMLRLNLAIPPTSKDTNPAANSPHRLGLLGGDLDGFPNGRRVFDDPIAIDLRAVAGATYPLVSPGFKPDDAVGLLADGTTNDIPYLATFPYLALPHEGYSHSH